jgi:D-alanyl-D-alanine carboxypeptidase/D-alanyl-D-alanine-endopeptidase (penicillin-binding protein 4)
MMGRGATNVLGMMAGLWIAATASAQKPNADEDIRRQLKEILRAPELQSAVTGVHVRSISDGRVVFDHHGSRLFNPASNMKLLTTAAALELLGASYQFRTEVRRDPDMTDGKVAGNLYVIGRGDPTLTTEAMFGLVNEIALRGVRTIEGDLVVDDSFFDDVREGPGWEQETGDPAYAAPIGAFSVNFNTFVVRVVPGDQVGSPARVQVWPDVDLIEPVADVVTRGARTRTRVWAGTSNANRDHVQVTIRGSIAVDHHDGVLVRRRVHNPTRYAGEMMKQLLAMRGIEVEGRVRRGVTSPSSLYVVSHYSRPLAEILSELNKYSNNFIAEQILKTLAAEVGEQPGSWEGGVAVLSGFLDQLGIDGSQYRLGNGSGLNDVNRVSPQLITELLRTMHERFEVRPEFVASLAVAGHSGTIGRRFEDTPADTRLRAKTGSLTGVSALSGYVVTRDDEILAFSIMMNDYEGRARPMWRIQDAIGVALANYGRPPALAGPPPSREPRAAIR